MTMTIEEKAKAYDEALKQAKFYHGNCPSEPERKKLEKMFPVLHESEDERIRKAIIELLKEVEEDETYTGRQHIPNMISYLEKQEQKPAWSDDDEEIIKFLEWLVGNHCWMGGVSRESVVRFLKDLRPQPKQMPAEWTPADEQKVQRILGVISGHKELEAEYFWLKGIQRFNKPAEWSDEDEKNSAFIVAALDAYNRLRKGNNNSAGQEEFDRAVNWIHHRFKSLRPQPKQEWSEEDEKMLDAMIDMVSNSLYEPLCPREGMLAWLKSFRRQRAEENLPKDLEEAANKFAVFYDQGTCDGIAQDCFIAGAKWDREQMMKEALEGWVAVHSDTEGKRRVTFFPKKPVRDVLTEYKYWAATRPSYESIKLDSNTFPDLKWEDEPKKVRIVIVKED